MSNAMLEAMAKMSGQGQTEETVREEIKLVLKPSLTLFGVGYFTEKPSPKGSGTIPACLYGILEGGGMVRLQGDDAVLWRDGLREAMVEQGFKDAVLEYEGKIVEPRLKGASWTFEIEERYVGRDVRHKIWDEGEAFEIHGGMLAGPTTIKVREHKPPRKATYTEIKLGYDE